MARKRDPLERLREITGALPETSERICLLEEGWRMVAPRRAVKQLDESRAR